MLSRVTSWGNYFKTDSVIQPLTWLTQPIEFKKGVSYLARGLGRSYGDCCLNDRGVLLATLYLNRLITFDQKAGVITCEAGVSLGDILSVTAPHGWFLPVLPGTKHVSVGGAIANDVHGKNHHLKGTFGEHVREMSILRSDGEVIRCDQDNNAQLFRATIGGLGLTGVILHASLELQKIESPWMLSVNQPFYSLDEFFEISAQMNTGYEYSVAWMDCASKGALFGRGIFMCGEHVASGDQDLKTRGQPRRPALSLPPIFPSGLLRPPLISAFNRAYYYAKVSKSGERSTHYDSYFFPLDAIGGWNRAYGRAGFFQFQGLIPRERAVFLELFSMLKNSEFASYLTVVKEFSERPSAGLMSFARPGITVCFDFPNRPGVPEFIKRLNDFACANNGAIYPAKDAGMSSNNFMASFPNANTFAKSVDNAFSSDFWRRVN